MRLISCYTLAFVLLGHIHNSLQEPQMSKDELKNLIINHEIRLEEKLSNLMEAKMADLLGFVNNTMRSVTEDLKELKNLQKSSVIEIKKSVNRGIGGFVNVNGTYLMFSSEKRTWTAAKDDCERFSSRLVVAPNLRWLLTYIRSNRKLYIHQYWVGASDQPPAEAGTYEWLDGTPVDSDLWFGGLPPNDDYFDYVGKPGQTCVKLHSRVGDYKIGLIATSDTNCYGSDVYHYICEQL
ncbi:unnamed protein product [Meganyctiphanes norvegica]|uniref:C-type lectin domain-containing protein n=1 Tax=Meganyctiphanes norvegica TaxID=48144 RepID=A0AAV2SD51_MEGNR